MVVGVSERPARSGQGPGLQQATPSVADADEVIAGSQCRPAATDATSREILHRKEVIRTMSTRTGADSYDDVLGRVKPAKGERAAVIPYLETDEVVQLRQQVKEVGEADGRALQQDGVVVLVTDRKFVAARTSGGFRPRWDVFTLPYGHLEPGVQIRGDRGTEVFVPTSGRRSYRIVLADSTTAAAVARTLEAALRDYRRDRMGLHDH